MRRLLLAATALATLASGAIIAALLLAPSPPATSAQRVGALAAELRCPDCQALSVAESRTAAAATIRGEIERLVAEGLSDEQVRDHFVQRYGEWILLAPPDPLVWWLPAAAVVVGLLALAAWLWSPRRPAVDSTQPGLRDADRRRLHDELESLDG